MLGNTTQKYGIEDYTQLKTLCIPFGSNNFFGYIVNCLYNTKELYYYKLSYAVFSLMPVFIRPAHGKGPHVLIYKDVQKMLLITHSFSFLSLVFAMTLNKTFLT